MVSGSVDSNKDDFYIFGNGINMEDWSDSKIDVLIDVMKNNVQEIRDVYNAIISRGNILVGLIGVIFTLIVSSTLSFNPQLEGRMNLSVLLIISLLLITASLILAFISTLKSKLIKDSIDCSWDRFRYAPDDKAAKIAYLSALKAIHESHKTAIGLKAKMIDYAMTSLVIGVILVTIYVIVMIGDY